MQTAESTLGTNRLVRRVVAVIPAHIITICATTEDKAQMVLAL